MKPCCLIFGFGYTAQNLAPKLVAQGFRVVATSRTPQSHSRNLDVMLIDFNHADIEAYLRVTTHLLICIPPILELGDVVLMKYGEIIKQCHSLQWVGYLSSTGVYGDYQGRWVNETSECIPHTPTGIQRLQTEKAWLTYAQENQLPLHTFRLAGIYGPGRNAIARLLSGKKQSIFKENQVFSRIHIEDITCALLASIQSPNPLSLYNLADDEPAPSHLIDAFAAALLNREPLPLIPLAQAHLSAMEKEFYGNNRKVANLKMKKELQITLKYPTYREGLTQIWRDNALI